MRVYVILDERASPDPPLGEAVETLLQREDAERFLEAVRSDDAELASHLRIEERELEAGRAELGRARASALRNVGSGALGVLDRVHLDGAGEPEPLGRRPDEPEALGRHRPARALLRASMRTAITAQAATGARATSVLFCSSTVTVPL